MFNHNLLQAAKTPFDLFMLGISILVSICVTVLFGAIVINFIEARGRRNPKKEKKSIVETGTMTMFFFTFYFLIRFRVGATNINSVYLHSVLAVVGLGIIVFGCIVNIKGRLALGKNWGNQIRIYDDHTLVQSGVYKFVRHPLYASIIWMFYGAALIYLNIAAFIANTFIFIPFMYYRAKQEEVMLSEHFEAYSSYKENTGMFFPRILGKRC